MKERIDEVSKYYKPALQFANIETWGFWIIAILSLCMPYSLRFGVMFQYILQVCLIVSIMIHFVFSQISKFYLVPKAERERRKQMLSDAFSAPLSHDKTSLYYNNKYYPSVQRLGANTMENALFSREVVANMLYKSRIITGSYVILWILVFAIRQNNLELLTWITQVVFSGAIVTQWINLEILRFRYDRVFEQLHAHFLHRISEQSPEAIATIINAFVNYESAKSSAGCLLSSKVFDRLNSKLTNKWEQIRADLKMDPIEDALGSHFIQAD